MQNFVPTDDFRALNLGLSLDEGLPAPSEAFSVFNAERSIWREFYTLHLTQLTT